MKKDRFTVWNKRNAVGATLAFLLSANSTVSAPVPATSAVSNAARQMTEGSKFYCNMKALSPAERAHHKELTDQLISKRKEIVETEKGYEFQFSPTSVSLGELADWVEAEGKCCPFFDFHIDLEQEGKLLCLRLTGKQEIKVFIREEFQVPAK